MQKYDDGSRRIAEGLEVEPGSIHLYRGQTPVLLDRAGHEIARVARRHHVTTRG